MSIFENEEDDMHSTFREVMEERLENAFGEYLYHEFKTDNRCRADFIKAEVDPARAWERVVHYGHDEAKPSGAYGICRVAREDGPLPRDELLRRPGGTSEENEEIVDWLIEHNYLLKDSDGWLRYQHAQHVLKTATAFELKLHDWEKGIRQAKNYRSSICWRGYVVLDADHISAAVKNLEEFKEERIGLMALSEDSAETIHEPKILWNHQPNNAKRVRALSESAFRDVLDENPPRGHERTPAYEISQSQNPYQAQRTAMIGDQVFEDE